MKMFARPGKNLPPHRTGMVAEIPLATLGAGRLSWSAVLFSIVVGAGVALTAWAQAVNRLF